MEKNKQPKIVKKAWWKLLRSLAGRSNCQAGKIDLRTKRNIIVRK